MDRCPKAVITFSYSLKRPLLKKGTENICPEISIGIERERGSIDRDPAAIQDTSSASSSRLELSNTKRSDLSVQVRGWNRYDVTKLILFPS